MKRLLDVSRYQPWRLRMSIRRRLGMHPRLLEDPFEAVARQKEKCAFLAPLAHYTHRIGFRFDQWNPFVVTARAIADGSATGYRTSPLFRYHEAVQPATAHDALIGFDSAPLQFKDWPPFMATAVPWSEHSGSDLESYVRRAVRNDYAGYSDAQVTIDDGCIYWGPIAHRLGQLEYRRLEALVESLSTRGYDRRYGDARNEILKRGAELLFVTRGGGMHRAVVMHALGFSTVPACPLRVVDIDRSADWPQVRSGLWDRQCAEKYFHHLFDFDYRQWAIDSGLESREATSGTQARAIGGGGGQKYDRTVR